MKTPGASVRPGASGIEAHPQHRRSIRIWSAAIASAVPAILAAAMAVHSWPHISEIPPTAPVPQPPPTPSLAPSPPGSLAALFDGRPPLTPTAGPADGAAIAAAAAARRPALWRGCTTAWAATKDWQQAPADALGPLVPWMMAHTKRGRAPVEFVLTKPDRGGPPLLRHTRPWESVGHQLRNVSVATLLGAGGGESLYHSGTLGGEATTHWRTGLLLAALEGHTSFALNDTPPLRPEEPQPPRRESFETAGAPRNGTTLRLWLSGRGVLSRLHYDKSHNVPATPTLTLTLALALALTLALTLALALILTLTFNQVLAQLVGRKRLLLWPPDALPGLHLYPATHIAFRQSQVPLGAAAAAAVQPPGSPAARVMATLPGFAAAGLHAAVGVDLEPGDCVYIPPYWGHGVYSVEPSVSLASFSNSWEQAPRTCQAPAVHRPCACRAHTVHMPRTCSAHVRNLPCSCSAHAAHLPCTCCAHMPCLCRAHAVHHAVPMRVACFF